MQAFVDAFGDAGFKARAFLPSYGLAEATLAVSIMPPGEGINVELVEESELTGMAGGADRPTRYRAIVNCGKAVKDMTIEVREEDGSVLPDRVIGKIWCTGPSIMSGYFRDEELTAACMQNGWLDTGDMGYLSDGYIYVVGRAKDMIIINGKNHWPQDIEWAVEQLPGFKAGDIAAFAITNGGEETPAVLVQCRTSDEDERQSCAGGSTTRCVRYGIDSWSIRPTTYIPTPYSGELADQARNLSRPAKFGPMRWLPDTICADQKFSTNSFLNTTLTISQVRPLIRASSKDPTITVLPTDVSARPYSVWKNRADPVAIAPRSTGEVDA